MAITLPRLQMLAEAHLCEFAKSDGGGKDDLPEGWKSLSFKGDTVYYKVSPVSWQQPNFGLQVQLTVNLDPNVRFHANNAESEFVRDETVKAYKKTAESLDDAALKTVFKWLTANGTKSLHRKVKDWAAFEKEHNSKQAAKDKLAKKGQKKLPAGHTVITNAKGFRFVQLPDGKTIIPNQGVNDYKSDQDLIDNFYAWRARN